MKNNGFSAEIARLLGRLTGRDASPARLALLEDTLALSGRGARLLSVARSVGVEISFDRALPAGVGGRRVQSGGWSNATGKMAWEAAGKPRLLLNPALPDADLVLTLAHELRHVMQDQVAPDARPGIDKSLFDAVALNRVREADAETAAIEVAAEVTAAGEMDLLARYREGAATRYQPMVAAFLREDRPDMARRAAFDAWYGLDAVRNGYDLGQIHEYRETLEAVEATVRAEPAALPALARTLDHRPLTGAAMAALAGDGNGQNYLDATGGFAPGDKAHGMFAGGLNGALARTIAYADGLRGAVEQAAPNTPRSVSKVQP